MFRRALIILTLTVLTIPAARAAKWQLDKAHSSIGFSVKHMVISSTTGTFADFDGFVEFDGEKAAGGKVEVTARMASVNTDDEKRDEHLRGGDFFDVDKFPTMNFTSKKVIAGEGSEFKLVGDLTIKGITQEVTFDCEFNGVVTDPWGNTKAGFSASAKINRQDFGVSWSKTLDSGGLVVGDEVKISIEIEAARM
ncbi:MAG: YceI family protein [bacterium]